MEFRLSLFKNTYYWVAALNTYLLYKVGCRILQSQELWHSLQALLLPEVYVQSTGKSALSICLMSGLKD